MQSETWRISQSQLQTSVDQAVPVAASATNQLLATISVVITCGIAQRSVQKGNDVRQGLCKKFADLDPHPSQENKSYLRTIYFPALEDFPQLVWLEHLGRGTGFQPSLVQMTQLMEGEHKAYIKLDCHRNLRGSLDYQIEAFYGIRLAADRASGNMSLGYLLPETAATHWNRPLLARGVDSQTDMPVDLDTDAVPAILAFLTWMSKNDVVYPGSHIAEETGYN
jgi:hypothetical protein